MADTRVYAALLRAGMAGQATYRASFAVELVGTAMGMGPPPGWSGASRCWTSARSWTRRSGSCRWVSGCAGR